MLTWTDCSARTPEQQIILAQLEILRRLERLQKAGALAAAHRDSLPA